VVVGFSKTMKVRIRTGVRIRDDKSWGGICYVPHRDDFFAANKEVFAVVKSLTASWTTVSTRSNDTFVALAKLGICDTKDPITAEEPYSGPSFLGEFPEIPTVSQPLVLNCFCTAHCPLRCIYCHADDLMQEFRLDETERDLENVASTASMVPAIVAVISGGDPLTQPDRARFLIEKLATQKAIVLDTSGVGDLDKLLPTLIDHQVHVRVSLDTISPVNDRLRPPNTNYITGRAVSREGAERTIRACLSAGLSVTVQSVISSGNESDSEWFDLRDWLLAQGVRNWVLHVAVKGGAARRIQNLATKKSRARGILPSPDVYEKLWQLVRSTERDKLPLDIRCTDTGNTPNSVLLIGSKGDLYTEGYARNGKVLLYSAGVNRPDLIKALWSHIDQFGHARRYLNWNPWFYEGKSIEAICYPVPITDSGSFSKQSRLVETESKHRVTDLRMLRKTLVDRKFVPSGLVTERDEYFDTKELTVSSIDNVVRLRSRGSSLKICYKGPLAYAKDSGKYSRIEFEVEAGKNARKELLNDGYILTWFFEKRRVEYRRSDLPIIIALDEVPEMGHFIEIEGAPAFTDEIEKALQPYLGAPETRNYKDLFIDFKRQQGVDPSNVKGAAFIAKSSSR
jgi:predicted adenylyl cyclase CyaB